MNETRFRSLCPVLDCPNTKIIYWQHSTCSGSKETIDTEGDVKCEGCGKKDFIMNWRYSCGEHKNGYQYADQAKAGKIIGALIGLTNNQEEIMFLVKCCSRINQRNGIV